MVIIYWKLTQESVYIRNKLNFGSCVSLSSIYQFIVRLSYAWQCKLTYATLLAAIDIIIEISLIELYAWLIGSSDPWVIYYLTARASYKFYDLLTSEKIFTDAGGEYKPVHK